MDKLTLQDVDVGIESILANADSLTEEAALLFQNDRMARAYTLAHLCCEELSKINMLNSIGVKLLLDIPINWKSFWKRFRNHKSKLIQDKIFNHVISEANKGMEKHHYFQVVGSVSARNDWKNESLYVSWKNGFQNPIEVIGREKAIHTILLARQSYEVNKYISDRVRRLADLNPNKIRHLKPVIEKAFELSIEQMVEISINIVSLQQKL